MNNGFSLIELMASVAIVGTLSLVAIPAYQNFILKAEGTEEYMYARNDQLECAIDPYKCSGGNEPTLLDPEKGETFCGAFSRPGSTHPWGAEGKFASTYLAEPKPGMTANDVLTSQLNFVGCNSSRGSIYVKRSGDGDKCRQASCNKSYDYMPGGNAQWVGDLLTETLTEIGVKEDDFKIAVISPPGTKLRDQEVEIEYKDTDDSWQSNVIKIGEQGVGKDYDL